MIFTVIVILISILLFLDYASKKRRYEISAGIPGPSIIPFFGSFYVFTIWNAKDAERIVIEFTSKYKGISRVWILNSLNLLISDPKYLEIIMSSTKHIKKSPLYDILRKWLRDGLLISTGSKWHSRRKVITPAFHFKILEEFVEVFDRQSAILVKQLRKHSISRKGFNVYPYVTLAALDVVSETAMGVNINAQTDANCEYVRAVSDITEIVMHRMSNSFIEHDLPFGIFAPKEKKRQDEAVKVLHNFTEKVIQQRRASLIAQNVNKSTDSQEDDTGAKKKMALLDILLKSTINGTPLTNADIREEVDTFMFEGHDTTTSGICYALYLISRHPVIQDKMFKEIQHVIGDDKDKIVTYADLQELKYVECVIKESMRLYPPVPIVGREFTEDIVIDGYKIPAGTELTIPFFIVMRNPDYFPNPDRFEPERHTMGSITEKMNAYAYLPFSAGPRNCIGQKFAMLEMKSTISKILRHYELLPLGDDPDPVINLVLKSTNGINIGIKSRVY